jgi:hypothetical protein
VWKTHSLPNNKVEGRKGRKKGKRKIERRGK